MKNKFTEIAGWIGTALVIAAYILVSFKVLPGDSVIYQLMNLLGAMGVLTVSLVRRVYQPAVIQVVWITVALAALLRIFRII